MKKIFVFIIFLLFALPNTPALAIDWPLSGNIYNPEKLNFSVTIKGVQNPYKVFAYYVMPGEKVTIKASGSVGVLTTDGDLKSIKYCVWDWIAPTKPGVYQIKVRRIGQEMTLNMFVLRPAKEMKKGRLGNYLIGSYPKRPLNKLKAYKTPKGFIEMTKENMDTPISPHFTLGQFTCKQSSAWPKYLILQEPLLIKLEKILEEVNKVGIRTDELTVMSGFRTPAYNKSIGSKRYSQHMYGGAADIFIDVDPKNNNMDDLNGDGKVNKQDAAYLYDIIDKLTANPDWVDFIGGLGEYGANHAHGPFIHVDARGYKARWGHKPKKVCK